RNWCIAGLDGIASPARIDITGRPGTLLPGLSTGAELGTHASGKRRAALSEFVVPWESLRVSRAEAAGNLAVKTCDSPVPSGRTHPFSQRHVPVSRYTQDRTRRLQSDDSGRPHARNCRAEWGGQEHTGQAVMPLLR